MRLPLNNVDADVSHVYTKAGASVVTDTAIHSAVVLIAALFANADTFSGVEYFTQADCVSAPVYQRSYDLSGGVSGSSGQPDTAWGQVVLTFKTTLGGRFKLQLMEPSYAVDQKFALSAGVDVNVDALVNYLHTAADVVAAYDNGYPQLPLNFVSKTNDTLRKKYFNP